MRSGLALAALLLPLSGCYVPPPGPPAYVQPGYPPPGYPPPGYDAYGNIYPGYNYNNGDPTLFVDGAVLPMIFFGGAWGYYDGRHEFHRAPDAVYRHLEQQRQAGAFRPGGGGFGQPHPEGRPPGFDPGRNPGSFRPAEQGRPPGFDPGPGAGSFRPAQQPRPMPAAAPRPAAPPAHEEHDRRRDCPPGQRC